MAQSSDGFSPMSWVMNKLGSSYGRFEDPQLAVKYVGAEVIAQNGGGQNVARNELLAKVLSSLLGLAASFTITYFGLKWLSNVLDPTKQDKKEARLRVRLTIPDSYD